MSLPPKKRFLQKPPPRIPPQINQDQSQNTNQPLPASQINTQPQASQNITSQISYQPPISILQYDQQFFQFFDQIFNSKNTQESSTQKEESIPITQFLNQPDDEKIPPWILKKLIPGIRYCKVISLYPSQARRLKKDVERTNKLPEWYKELQEESMNSTLFFTRGVYEKFNEFKTNVQNICTQWKQQREEEGVQYFLDKKFEQKEMQWKIVLSHTRYQFWYWFLMNNPNMRRYRSLMDRYVNRAYPTEKNWDTPGTKHIFWMDKLTDILPDWAREAVDYRYLNTFDLF